MSANCTATNAHSVVVVPYAIWPSIMQPIPQILQQVLQSSLTLEPVALSAAVAVPPVVQQINVSPAPTPFTIALTTINARPAEQIASLVALSTIVSPAPMANTKVQVIALIVPLPDAKHVQPLPIVLPVILPLEPPTCH